MKRYMCLLCGLIYSEAEGWPEEGIPAGTAWCDVPPNWRCPDCDACKDDFEMIEV
jgi:rubredoxin